MSPIEAWCSLRRCAAMRCAASAAEPGGGSLLHRHGPGGAALQARVLRSSAYALLDGAVIRRRAGRSPPGGAAGDAGRHAGGARAGGESRSRPRPRRLRPVAPPRTPAPCPHRSPSPPARRHRHIDGGQAQRPRPVTGRPGACGRTRGWLSVRTRSMGWMPDAAKKAAALRRKAAITPAAITRSAQHALGSRGSYRG
jgi:hypothetical protein